MEKKRRKDPRKRLGTSQKKAVVTISVRVNLEEYNGIVELCKEKDITLSEYIRDRVIVQQTTDAL